MKALLIFPSFFALLSTTLSATPFQKTAAAETSVSDDDYSRPSVSNKECPDVVTTEKNGEEYAAVVKYENSDEEDVTKVNVAVTSYEDCEKGNFDSTSFLGNDIEKQTQITSDIKKAYQEIQKGEHLEDLKHELTALASKQNGLYDETVYTVTDLFDVSINVNANEYVVITFKGDASRPYTQENTAVIHRDSATGQWKMAEVSNVTSGNATVKFNSLCPVAILEIDHVKADAAVEKNSNVVGEVVIWACLITAVTGVLAAAGYAIFSKKGIRN